MQDELGRTQMTLQTEKEKTVRSAAVDALHCISTRYLCFLQTIAHQSFQYQFNLSTESGHPSEIVAIFTL